MRATFFGLAILAATAAAQTPEQIASMTDGIVWVRYALHRNWTVELGLPQNTVRALEQTQDGALWIATFGGLSRFDGKRFTNFNEANTPELGSSFLRSLKADSAGRLWIGTSDGHVALRQGRTFRGFGPEDGVPGADVRSLVEAGDGTIVACSPDGLARFDGQRFVPLELGAGLAPVQPQHLFADTDGTLWCAAMNGLFQLGDGSAKRIELRDGASYSSASYVARAEGVGLWTKTDRGLARVEGGELVALRHVGLDANWNVESAVQLADQSLFLGTGNSLLNVAISGDVAHFASHWMEEMEATALLVDREGSLWIGSRSLGLSQHERTPATPIEFSALELRRGNLMFAAANAEEFVVCSSEGGRILRMSARTGMMRNAAKVPRGSRRITGLLATRDGALWILHELGLQRNARGKTTDVEFEPASYTSPMLEDARGIVWCGDRGALRRVENETLRTYGAEAGILEDEEITSLCEDASGRLWVGTSHGLLALAGERFERLGRADGLPGGAVRALLARPDGTLWIGTYGGGIARYRDGKFAYVTAEQGLYSDAIARIEHDGQGLLWVNSNRGVFRLRLEALERVADGKEDAVACLGLRTPEAGGLGGVRLESGHVVFATVEGLVLVDPSSVSPPNIPPGIELRAIDADGRQLDLESAARVPPGPRELNFHYAGVALVEPDALRYRYRLENFDPDWRDAGEADSVRYTNVPPGRYRFEVKARSHDGTWSSAPAAIDLDLEPYVHETLWFRLCALLVGSGVVVLAFDRRTRTAVRRQRMLQAEVERRTKAEDSLHQLTGRLIEAQEDERRRVALELHDDLGQRVALLGVGLDLLAQDPRADGPGGIAGELRALADSVNGISRDVHGMSHRLHSTKLDKLGLEAALRSLCRELSEQHQIAVEFSATCEPATFERNSELTVYRVAQEALRNALRHGDPSSVQVDLSLSRAGAELSVRDDGRGFDAAAAARREGLGLQGMEERVRLVGGTLLVETAPGAGTRIAAHVPGNGAAESGGQAAADA